VVAASVVAGGAASEVDGQATPLLTSPSSVRLLSRSLNVPQEFIESLLVRIRKIALIE
jgi:hypothetical protein